MQDIQSLLDLSLEIEGLLRVLAIRDDSNVSSLLRQKAAALASALGCEPKLEIVAAAGAADPLYVAEDADGAADPDDVHGNFDIDADFSVDIVDFEADSVRESPAQAPAEPAAAPRSFMTLNEKFRFVRELFDNKHALMAEVVSRVTDMQSLPQAHDYILNDLGFDEDNPVVIEFLEVVNRYFNSRS